MVRTTIARTAGISRSGYSADTIHDHQDPEVPSGSRKRRPRRNRSSMPRGTNRRQKKRREEYLDIGSEMCTGDPIPTNEIADLLGIHSQRELRMLFDGHGAYGRSDMFE
jgi:hypothetical protein